MAEATFRVLISPKTGRAFPVISGITLDVSPLLEVLGQLGPAAGQAAARALYQEAESIIGEAKEQVPVHHGILRDSGHVQLPETGPSGVTVRMGFGGAASGYALYVHEGTGPAVGQPAYWPPRAALEEWARAHGIPVFLVQRAIHRRGTRPAKYLERPALEAARGMEARLAASLRAELERR